MKVVTLGEILLRLTSPVGKRLTQAQQFGVHYGGGEMNVGISLANFGHQVNVATVLPQQAIGRAALEHLQQYGVNVEHIVWHGERLGIYYVERGASQKATNVLYDRHHSSFVSIDALPWNMEELFTGVNLFHLSGLVPALSPQWSTWTIQLLQVAKQQNCKISFDINFRSKLWSHEAASKVLEEILPYVDYCSAGRLDAALLLHVCQLEEEITLAECYRRIGEKYPNIQLFYATNRQVFSNEHHQLQGFVYTQQQLFQSRQHEIQPVIDRIGGGDAFAAGILNGVLRGWDPQKIVEFGTAASVLKHSVEGDCNVFSEEEVLQWMQQESGKIVR